MSNRKQYNTTEYTTLISFNEAKTKYICGSGLPTYPQFILPHPNDSQMTFKQIRSRGETVSWARYTVLHLALHLSRDM